MAFVVFMLGNATLALPIPSKPAIFTSAEFELATTSSLRGEVCTTSVNQVSISDDLPRWHQFCISWLSNVAGLTRLHHTLFVKDTRNFSGYLITCSELSANMIPLPRNRDTLVSDVAYVAFACDHWSALESVKAPLKMASVALMLSAFSRTRMYRAQICYCWKTLY